MIILPKYSTLSYSALKAPELEPVWRIATVSHSSLFAYEREGIGTAWSVATSADELESPVLPQLCYSVL
jgi:hypothetical protein